VNSLPKTVKVWEIVGSEFPGYVYLMSLPDSVAAAI